MKFAAILRENSEFLPDSQDLFTRYKSLKKSLKRRLGGEGIDSISSEAAEGSESSCETHAHCLAEVSSHTLLEQEFVAALMADIKSLNDQFIEREELAVINLGEVETKSKKALESKDIDSLMKARGSVISLQCQLTLLKHWSILGYTSLVKILKKHHKRTGVALFAPTLENMLSQPFCSVEIVSEMLEKTGNLVDALLIAIQNHPLPMSSNGSKRKRKLETIIEDQEEQLWLKRTEAALRMWDQLSNSAVTPSTIFPPATSCQ